MDIAWEEKDTQLVCTVKQEAEVMGYVAIDSTVGGRACGGLRLLPDVDEEEMRGLARAMTLKYGFLGLPQGGAKAGVRGDPEAPLAERRRRLVAFAQAIAPLLQSHVYVPGPDMGTSNEDIRHMLTATGVPVKARELRHSDSGYYTALTTFVAARQATSHLGFPLKGCTAAVEGFGKVGSALAGLLAQAGVRVVAISTSRGALYSPQGLDVAQLSALAAEVGSAVVEHCPEAQRIERAALLELPVDMLCPCARHGSVNAGNASHIRARIVCPGANNPVTPEAEQALAARGVLCLPDFVCNSGGVLGGTMAFASVRRPQIEAFIVRHIEPRIAQLLNEAAVRQVLPREVAVPLALARHAQVQQGAAHPSLMGRAFGYGLELYRRGWVPGALVGRLSLPYFARTLA